MQSLNPMPVRTSNLSAIKFPTDPVTQKANSVPHPTPRRLLRDYRKRTPLKAPGAGHSFSQSTIRFLVKCCTRNSNCWKKYGIPKKRDQIKPSSSADTVKGIVEEMANDRKKPGKRQICYPEALTVRLRRGFFFSVVFRDPEKNPTEET